LTCVGLNLYAVSAALWMPYSLVSDQHQFGFVGVALALASWFTGAGAVVVVGACAGAVFADEEGTLGTLTRGGQSRSVLRPVRPRHCRHPTTIIGWPTR
jgi:hypothetical protein